MIPARTSWARVREVLIANDFRSFGRGKTSSEVKRPPYHQQGVNMIDIIWELIAQWGTHWGNDEPIFG